MEVLNDIKGNGMIEVRGCRRHSYMMYLVPLWKCCVYSASSLSHKSRREHDSDKCLYYSCFTEPIKRIKHTRHTPVCTKNADNKAVMLIYTDEEVLHSEVSENLLKDVVYTRCNKVAQDEKHSYIFLPVQPQQLNLVKPPFLLSIYQSIQSTGSLSFIAAEFLLRQNFL